MLRFYFGNHVGFSQEHICDVINLLMREIITSHHTLRMKGCTDEVLIDRACDWFKYYYGDVQQSCAGFLYWNMKGILPSQPPPFWETRPSVEPTHFVLLDDRHASGKNHHYALFVPTIGCYLSQYGNGGAIVLSDLLDMTSFFETPTLEFIAEMHPCYV